MMVFMLSFALPLTSCVVSTPHRHKERPHHKRPPGHQKKVYGDRSAKRYAPGQQKKKMNKKHKHAKKHKTPRHR